MHASTKPTSTVKDSNGTKGALAIRSSMYRKSGIKRIPISMVTNTYAFCQPTIGAWFHAKLKSTRAVIPTIAPGRSSSLILSRRDWFANSAFFGGSGITNEATTAMTARAIAKEKNAHGHQVRANRPAKRPPTTEPPAKIAISVSWRHSQG